MDTASTPPPLHSAASALPLPGPAPVGGPAPAPASAPAPLVRWPWVLGSLCALSLLLHLLQWNRLERMSTTLARSSADTQALARQAQEGVRAAQTRQEEGSARIALLDAKVAELAAQRNQVELLLQNATRSRNEVLLANMEASLRLAEQQVQLVGNAQPLVVAISAAQAQLAEAGAPPQLAPVARALQRDKERVQSSTYADIPAALAQVDEAIALTEDLVPIAQAVPAPAHKASATPAAGAGPSGITSAGKVAAAAKSAATASAADSDASVATASTPAGNWWQGAWWQAQWQAWLSKVRAEALDLVRVDVLAKPDAALLTPPQAQMAQQHLRQMLLSARLGLLSHRFAAAAHDVEWAQKHVQQYFDAGSPGYKRFTALLTQLRAQLAHTALPATQDSLAAIASATAGLAAQPVVAMAVPASAPAPASASASASVPAGTAPSAAAAVAAPAPKRP